MKSAEMVTCSNCGREHDKDAVDGVYLEGAKETYLICDRCEVDPDTMYKIFDDLMTNIKYERQQNKAYIDRMKDMKTEIKAVHDAAKQAMERLGL